MSKALVIVCGLLMLHATALCGQVQVKTLSFTVPLAPWSMTLPSNDFVIKEKNIKPDGSAGYFYVVDERKHLNVSFFIEPVGACKDSKSCRDMVWKAGNPGWEKPQDVVLSQIGEISFFEFMVPSFRGQPVQQQNMYAQFVVDGFWVDFHISKVLYKPAEHELFEGIVKSIKFEQKTKSKS